MRKNCTWESDVALYSYELSSQTSNVLPSRTSYMSQLLRQGSSQLKTSCRQSLWASRTSQLSNSYTSQLLNKLHVTSPKEQLFNLSYEEAIQEKITTAKKSANQQLPHPLIAFSQDATTLHWTFIASSHIAASDRRHPVAGAISCAHVPLSAFGTGVAVLSGRWCGL